MNRSALLASLAIVLAGPASGFHPPGADGHHDDAHREIDAAKLRIWSNARTGESVRGAFLAARVMEGQTRVSIERENGDIVVFAIDDLAQADQDEARHEIEHIRAFNDAAAANLAVAAPIALPVPGPARPPQAAPFDAFAPFVSTRWDDRWLYVESDGLPHVPGSKGAYAFSHPMMVGITAWQQQVPLPQHYRGSNAWQIPLKPELADRPVSAKDQLFRGAIALAANGVPIFNPIKNDGRTDTYLAGELDEFGGHCGRADDYHYHIAPTHLQKFVGVGQPIAYALDGFPIFGLFDPAARPGSEKACPLGGTAKLDELNGHEGAPPKDAAPGAKGLYHYHASASYPYLNGGMRGKVTVKEDQIDPQPRANPVRDWLQPLRGARITNFKSSGVEGEPAWSLEYSIDGRKGFVNYRIQGEGPDAKYQFEFINTDGSKSTSTYSARPAPGGGKGQRGGPPDAAPQDRRPRDNDRRPRRDEAKPNEAKPRDQAPAPGGFALSSPDVTDGRLSIECTCDGKSRSPALTWSDPPAGARSLAIAMHHDAPDGDTHVYFAIANLPAATRSLESGARHLGVWGSNTVNRRSEYAPPCSQGPGDKTYTITLYALSGEASLKAGYTRDELLSAIKDKTIASASMDVVYARAGDAQPPNQPPKPPREPGRKGGQGGEKRRGQDANADAPPPADGPGLLARMTAFKTDVPAHPWDAILVRPTDRSITVSVVAQQPSRAIVEYWPASSTQKNRTKPSDLKPGVATNFELPGLAPATAYRYRVGTLASDSANPQWGEEQSFRTRVAPGREFTFVVQADSHLDQGVEPKVYEQTLTNMRDASPDLFIDLGDTFMTDKRGPNFKSALPQYDAQRWYLSRVAQAAPLFMVLGNHDGEKGSSGLSPDDIGPWSYAQRTSRFPAPEIDGRFYTGATGMSEGVGSHYYAFEWGDAVFIVLDPFWPTTDRIRGGGNRGGPPPGAAQGRGDAEPVKPLDASWTMTLGRPQYDWLARTLASTRAAHRFVFIHHLVGGKGGPEARGGMESSFFFEWGGQNADGSPGFAEHRPGWPMPIHDLLAKHNVSAVFHGHDHLYVHSQRDSVQYQCVPQPGNPVGNTRTAAEYGYAAGTIQGSPGHLRVRVNPSEAAVEFVRTAVPGVENDTRGRKQSTGTNGQIVDRYTIPARSTP